MTRKQNAPPKENAKAAPVNVPVDDDPVPENIEEFRAELARRISRFIGERAGYWRTCRERSCRRHRACRTPHVRCSAAPPPAPRKPEDFARTAALIQRALREWRASESRKDGAR